MPLVRTPDGLDRISLLAATLLDELRIEDHRRRAMKVQFAFFAVLFITLVLGESMFATMLFSIISIEVLGVPVSGAAFAMVVPSVIGMAHVKLHHEGDNFTRLWLKHLSGIGILLFALGISVSIGFAAWQATSDALSVLTTGPQGMLGGAQVATAPSEEVGLIGWIGSLPNALLFLGLSFGMIINIAMASFAVGKALDAFNILTMGPRADRALRSAIKQLHWLISCYRRLWNENEVEKTKLPIDLKLKFAREAFHACWSVGQTKLTAVQRKFDPARRNDPVVVSFGEADAASIPNRFTNEADFIRHLNQELDAVRTHNILRILSGIPDQKE